MQHKFKVLCGRDGKGWLYTMVYTRGRRVEIYEFFAVNFFNGKKTITFSEPNFFGLFKGDKKLRVNEERDGDLLKEAFMYFKSISVEEKEKFVSA